MSVVENASASEVTEWRVGGLAETLPPSQRIRLSRYFRAKHWLDRSIALVLLIPALPIIALLALLTRLSSPGPGIFRQQRVGRDGRLYTMYKIRSMRQDAESKSGAVWATDDDPRMTTIGAVLRRLHLDELPQLWNVVRGEMALVGPRPERPEFVPVLAQMIQGYEDRLAVLPGITGLAQLALPPDTDLDSVRRKLALDMRYIERGGVWLDFRVILYTGARISRIPNRWLSRLLGMGGWLEVPRLSDALRDGTGAQAAPVPAAAISAAVSDSGNGRPLSEMLPSKKPR